MILNFCNFSPMTISSSSYYQFNDNNNIEKLKKKRKIRTKSGEIIWVGE